MRFINTPYKKELVAVGLFSPGLRVIIFLRAVRNPFLIAPNVAVTKGFVTAQEKLGFVVTAGVIESMKKPAAILLSRQPMRPTGRDDWVRQSVAAVRWLKSEGYAICSSLGMPTWDLLTALASLEKMELKLFLPTVSARESSGEQARAIAEFELDSALVDFIPVGGSREITTRESRWLLRDRAVIEAARLLIPVSVRDNGYMDRFLREADHRGKEVDERFRVSHQPRRQLLAYTINSHHLNPELSQLGDRYLIHWTRASNSAWPTERLIDYYLAVIQSENYPRSGFCTLMNILETGRLAASGKNMPGGIETVSFSATTPADMISLMRWRSRYRQMSFEPYGVGIEREQAILSGIRPVEYSTADHKLSRGATAWLSQSIGRKTDWRAEQEYRCRGDMDLSMIPTERLIAVCRISEEAAVIEKTGGIRAVPFLSEQKM